MEAAVAVFLLWVNPLKDSVMLETSIWILLQQYQQKFLLLSSSIGDSSWCAVWFLFIYSTFWKKTKIFFSVNTPGYVPTYFYLCIIHLCFVQPFYKCWDFHFMCEDLLRFFTVTLYKQAKTSILNILKGEFVRFPCQCNLSFCEQIINISNLFHVFCFNFF